MELLLLFIFYSITQLPTYLFYILEDGFSIMGRISLDLDENTHELLRKRIAECIKKLKEKDKNAPTLNQRTFIQDLIKKELGIS